MNGKIRANILAQLVALSCAVLVLAAAPPAQAEAGKIRVAWAYVIRYADFDPTNPADRLVLLGQVEAAASAYCDQPATRIDREACARATIDRSLRDAPPAVGQALMQSWHMRDNVQQAAR